MNIITKIATWFQREPMTDEMIRQQAENLARFHKISTRSSGKRDWAGYIPLVPQTRPASPKPLGRWETHPDPFNPEVMIEHYVPAFEEMSQVELGRWISKQIQKRFEGQEATFQTGRLVSAIHVISRFYRVGRDRSLPGAHFRGQQELVDDLPSVQEACRVLAEYAQTTLPEDDNDIVQACHYLTVMANRTWVDVIAQASIDDPMSGVFWEELAGKLDLVPAARAPKTESEAA